MITLTPRVKIQGAVLDLDPDQLAELANTQDALQVAADYFVASRQDHHAAAIAPLLVLVAGAAPLLVLVAGAAHLVDLDGTPVRLDHLTLAPPPSHADRAQCRPNPFLADPAWLRRTYVDQKLSPRRISEMTGATVDEVLAALESAAISIRKRGGRPAAVESAEEPTDFAPGQVE